MVLNHQVKDKDRKERARRREQASSLSYDRTLASSRQRSAVLTSGLQLYDVGTRSHLSPLERSDIVKNKRTDKMVIRLSARKTARWLAISILFLVFAHVVGQLSRFLVGYDYVKGLVPLFNLEHEANVPTWFSSGLLLVSAALIAAIAWRKKESRDRYFRHWLALSIIFLFLSLDEAAQIHEMTTGISRDIFKASGLLYYAWIIPAGSFVLILCVTYLGFLLHLPLKIRHLFLLSAVLFLSGAMGLEMFEGRLTEVGRYMDASYTTLVTFEEALEMTGAALLVYSLLSYLRSMNASVEISFVE